MAKDPDLLAEIERGALSDAVPLATILRKCVSLGGVTRSAELRDWASQELGGYVGETDKLPAYRVIYAPIQVDGIRMPYRFTGQQISVTDLPDFAQDRFTNEVPLASGVGALEALVRNAQRGGEASIKLSPPGSAELAKYMNLHNSATHIDRVYWSVSTAIVEGVLDQIRTTLVRLASEMRAIRPAGATVPSQEAAAEAVSVVLHGGKRHTVNINTAQARDGGDATVAVTSPGESKESRWSKVATIWTVIGVVVAVVTGYFTYRQWRG